MVPKTEEKERAILLRKEGFSYSEVLKQIPVAKSTLSLWLRSVGLSKRQKQRLTQKKLDSIKRGWLKWHQKRVDLVNKLRNEAKSEIKDLTNKDLWLIGVALYWAEGAKEKEYRPGQQVQFSNSDPLMIRVFLKWLKDVIKVKEDEIKHEIYIHENSKNNIKSVIKYWAEIANTDIDKIKQHVYFKRNKLSTNRKNINDKYFGLLRVRVKKSSTLNRKITGWIEGICENCRVV